VGDGHELIQGCPTNGGVEWEVDVHDVKDDALRAVVLRRHECHREGDAITWNDGAQAHT
jgi:hypothetical protein